MCRCSQWPVRAWHSVCCGYDQLNQSKLWNPTLNLPDSVNKCKTDIETYLLLMQPCYFSFHICRFKLFCRTVIIRISSPPKYVFVLRELPNKLTIYENPWIRCWICVMLTIKSIRFQISQHINTVLKLQHDILQVIVWKWRFINIKSVNLCEKESKVSDLYCL